MYHQPTIPWITFKAGPGGEPLGDAPKSIGVNRPVALCQNVAIQGCSAPQADVNSGSYDPDGDPFTLAQAPAGPYPLGTTRVTLQAVDALGLSSSCMANVNVFDAAPPAVSGASASPASLWPPNKKMVPVSVALSATDTCSGDVTSSCRIVSISGDDSASAGDWQITGPRSAELRADRAGYVASIHAESVGLAAVAHGAGRARKEDAIDPAVGLELLRKVGDPVRAGEPIAILHHRDGRGLEGARERLAAAYRIDDAAPLRTGAGDRSLILEALREDTTP
jgi:hypothetical protein